MTYYRGGLGAFGQRSYRGTLGGPGALGAVDQAAVTNYLIALNNLMNMIPVNREAVRRKVAAWEATAQQQGTPVWYIIEATLKPWNAWDQAAANLADVTIPLEIKRIQQGGEVTSTDLAPFTPPPPPTLPGFQAPAWQSTAPAPVVSPYTPIKNQWGQAGKEVPPGSTINYGNLNQLYQQAQAAGNIAEANRLADQINAITDAGPVAGGFVPVTGVDSQGEAVTPGAGIVHTSTGIVDVLGTTTAPPTVTDGSTEGGVPALAPTTPPPVLIETVRPSGTLTPTTPTASGGGGTFTSTPKAPKPSTGGGDYGDGTGTGPAPTMAGVPGGALGVLAVLGIGLALLARGKK